MKKLLLLMFLLSALPAFAASKKPDITPEYSASKYLTATGIGQSEQEARRQAKAEMSSIFESTVMSSVLSIVRSATSESGEETVTRDAEQKIGVLSAVELKGVTIGKTWYDEKQNVYYALAVLNRQKARREWQEKIDSMDDKIEITLNSLESMPSPFSKLRSLLHINKLWLERQVIASRLRVLGFEDASITDYEIRDIYKKIHSIKASMRIYLDFAEDNYTKTVASLISEQLGQEGYIITTERDNSNITLKGSVTLEQVDIKNPDWKYARATVSVAIMDTHTNEIVGKIEENKRGSHLTYSEAAHNAIKKVSKVLTVRILDYFKDPE
ncbi:MAG: LPP20 family lipoprotein [bacterium]